MGKPKKPVCSSRNRYTILQNMLEFGIYLIVADSGVEEEILAILVTELDPDEVLMMIREFAKDTILGFQFRTMQGDSARSDHNPVDTGQVRRWP